jgi:hypothetical protein
MLVLLVAGIVGAGLWAYVSRSAATFVAAG